MALKVNLRHLDAHNLRLRGLLSVEELDIDPCDEMIRLEQALDYDLEVQKLEGGLLVEGRLALPLECQCVRCLKPFRHELRLEDYTTLLPFTGEDAVVVANDCVDLTVHLREDILLGFPQHPVCAAECRGLPRLSPGQTAAVGSGEPITNMSAWAELNKLKF